MEDRQKNWGALLEKEVKLSVCKDKGVGEEAVKLTNGRNHLLAQGRSFSDVLLSDASCL